MKQTTSSIFDFNSLPQKFVNPFDALIEKELRDKDEFSEALVRIDKINPRVGNPNIPPTNEYSPDLYNREGKSAYYNGVLNAAMNAVSFIYHTLYPSLIVTKDEFTKIDLPRNVCQFVRCDKAPFAIAEDIEMIFPAKVGRIEIAQDELQRFTKGTWLSDDCINGYLALITAKHTNVHAYNTNFYTFLKQGYPRVKRHTKKVNIFKKDVLVFPIHHPGHWALGICLINYKKLIYIDSMGNGNGYTVLNHMKEYLIAECNDKPHPEGKRFLAEIGDLKLINLSNNPQQNNGNDCGMFTIIGAKAFAAHYKKLNSDCSASEICEILTFNQVEMPYWRALVCTQILKNSL